MSQFRGHTTEHALKIDARKEELWRLRVIYVHSKPKNREGIGQTRWKQQEQERTAKIKSTTERQCKAERKRRNSAACKTVLSNSNGIEGSKRKC